MSLLGTFAELSPRPTQLVVFLTVMSNPGMIDDPEAQLSHLTLFLISPRLRWQTARQAKVIHGEESENFNFILIQFLSRPTTGNRQ
jgi:hypothetical protein